MMTIWKSLIQSTLDYTSQLWSPSDQASICRLENIARHFTAKIMGLEGLDYWDRLKSLRLYSQERRRDRYQILFLWKVAQGQVKGYKATFVQNERRGRLMQVAPLCNRAPTAVKNARESSLQVRGANLFNCIPRELRTSPLALQTSSKLGLMIGCQVCLTSQPSLENKELLPQIRCWTKLTTSYKLETNLQLI